MAGKLGPLTDQTPRDASKLGSNPYTPRYLGVTFAIIGLVMVLYWAA
jgi:hypothetical protein